ncbi:hypothetical protein SAMN02745866_02817 [Alteromonadaceae bacterium Bs31]|nr:hypothetical protein SAMN02745866_02817 [Alteromonadaceae bacterium Bs31]
MFLISRVFTERMLSAFCEDKGIFFKMVLEGKLIKWISLYAVLGLLFACHSGVQAAQKEELAGRYPLSYTITLLPSSKMAKVSIEMGNTHLVSLVDFNISKSSCRDFSSENKLQRKTGHLLWFPSGKQASIHFHCEINQLRASSNGKKSYDALITPQWAVFRGDDLVPPAKVRAKKGASSKATLVFELPDSWASVHTEWPRLQEIKQEQPEKYRRSFKIDNPSRKFDRPTGWMIAGDLGTRNAKIGEEAGATHQVWVSAPTGSGLRRMEVLTFVQLLWPHLQTAFGQSPDKLLVVGAGEPLWRGGLSAKSSFFLHVDRPLISENGTSTLVHELVHVFTGLSGKLHDDWIAEGIAEYYSYIILQRAGGYNQLRVARIEDNLSGRASKVKKLRVASSSGATTAAAALLFRDLNAEIMFKTKNKKNLDTVVQALVKKKKVSLADLRQVFMQVVGSESTVLQSHLLHNKG